MTNKNTLTNESLLRELGTRVEQLRIRKNLTQAQLAKEAGIGKRTLERFEKGETVQLTTFVAILRVLDLLNPLLDLIPDQNHSPMQQLLQEKKMRYRASPKAGKTIDETWTWND
ncbi:helix-turn-helix domain-containing protein [Rubritalea spongiae]|uniref:Helix-turn-helix domain-containing protein n=1 Tax=Rubritalea spongiae TaxID=430797 RepID=A0ABW5E571_9BACT